MALLQFTLTFLFNFILIFHIYMYNPKQKKNVINEYTFFVVDITNKRGHSLFLDPVCFFCFF